MAAFGNPWEIVCSEITFDVKLGGYTEPYWDQDGRYRVRWCPERMVTRLLAVPISWVVSRIDAPMKTVTST